MQHELVPLTEEEEELIENKINEYADSMAPAFPRTKEERLVYKVTGEDGNIIGGSIVNIYMWGRAVLATLWVDERYRRHGLGSMLIRASEKAAREKGCYYLCLGTVDYMARPLYEKHGFKVFTVNNDIPKGHVSWSLCKRLDTNAPDYVPSDNTATEKYKVMPGTKEDAAAIRRRLEEFCIETVPEKHEYITLSKKLVDKEGKMIAAAVYGVDEDDNADLDCIWVEEKYRGQGIGGYLANAVEREVKENGAYVILSQCCDWVSGFFFANGYTARGALEDYPKGHTAYELEKRI